MVNGPSAPTASESASRSRSVISVGFVFVLALLVVIIVLGFSRMAHVQEQLERIVHEHNVKAQLLNGMRFAARERSLALARLTLYTDPFDIHDTITEFRQHASDFMVQRNELLEMPLSEHERAMLEEQFALTRDSVLVQNRVLEAIQAGDLDRATRDLLEHGIPMQEDVLAELDAMLEVQREKGEAAVQEAAERYRGAVALMFILGGLAVVLGAGVAWAVTRRTVRIESELFEAKERAQVTLQAIGDGVITTDLNGHVDYLNPVAEQLTGWGIAQAQGRQLDEVFRTVKEGAGTPLEHPMQGAPPDGAAANIDQDILLVSRKGMEFAIEEVSAPIRDRNGEIIGAALVFRDVSRARQLARDLSWAATHDALTGLTNRAEFERRLEHLATMAQSDEREHALLYLDLDQFKVVNDTSGHTAGDELLKQLVPQLQDRLRANDTLARLGGDEFGILLEGCPLERAAQIAEVLRQSVDDFRFTWHGKSYQVGVSIGVVPIVDVRKSPAKLLSDADAACYVAKDSGRNRIHVSRPNDSEVALRQGEMNWLQTISRALGQDRFALHHQHIVPLAGKGYPDREVLLRMEDESGELIFPGAFIPAAERYHMMPSVDRWVIAHLFRFLAEDPQAPQGRYAINLSAQSLCDPRMYEYITAQFDATGIPAGRICFEITETAAIENLSQATQFIAALKQRGCYFSLDDFGVGMSSFGYLKTLQVDFLKIDGSFVRDIPNNEVSRAMVESIVRIAHLMDIKTVAEAVGNQSLVAELKCIGIDYAQGFGLHMPEPLTDSAAGIAQTASDRLQG